MEELNHFGGSRGERALDGNPWQGFAHPEHREEEFEPLQRTLRFALIQFNKFWVEVNAFPVFMNELKGASVSEIERLFGWMRNSPRWSDQVHCTRLIPELRRPETRDSLLKFSDEVKQLRALREQLVALHEREFADAASLSAALIQLDSALALIGQFSLEDGRRDDLKMRIQEASARLSRNHQARRFFARLVREASVPMARDLREAGKVFQAVDWIRKTPRVILEWRRPQILSAQAVRLQAWHDRAKPLLEARTKLTNEVNLDTQVEAVRLRELASALTVPGAFRSFTSAYKKAVQEYQSYLKLEAGAKAPKETPVRMAERLSEWASYLESKSAFDTNADARAIFEQGFMGIDTDFANAIAANAWAAECRQQFGTEAGFSAAVLDYLFSAPIAKLESAVAFCTDEETRRTHEILLEREYADGGLFDAVGYGLEARLIETTHLYDLVEKLGLKSELVLGELKKSRGLVAEMLSLLKSMSDRADVKNALKNSYLGEGTDLTLIDQALEYVRFIEGAALPGSLKNSFLTAYGPQRLADTALMVEPALNGLSLVKDHLLKLDTATYGQSRSLSELPLLDLINRIQKALKLPGLLGESVGLLRRL